MKIIGRRELATGLTLTALAASYSRPALATTPIGVVSVPTVADIAAIAPANGMTVYVQGRATPDDGFQGLFVAASESGYTVDGVLVVGGASGWVWLRQITNSTYLSTWWPVDTTGNTPCESALSQFFNALPNNSVGVLCAGSYLLGASAGWTPLTLSNKTNVRLIGEGVAQLVAKSMPSYAIGGFVYPLVSLTGCTSCEVADIHFNAAQYSPTNTAALAALACSETLFARLDGAGFSGNATFAEGACTASTWYMCRAHDSATGSATRGFWLGNAAPLTPYVNGGVTADLRVYKCEAINNTATGIVLGALRAICEGCISSNNLGGGIISPDATGFSTGYQIITGNRCEGNGYGYQTDSYSSSSSSYNRNIVLSNNIFQGNTAGGMLINNALTFAISGNICANNFSPTGKTTGGIQIVGNCSDISVSGNICISDNVSTQQSYGISVGAAPSQSLTRISLAGNLCNGNLYGIFATVVDSTGSITAVTITGNIAERNSYGIFLVNSGSFTELIVNGNASSNNSTLDIRCTVAGGKLRGNKYGLPPLFASNVPYPTFASDGAAGAGGLMTGEEYVLTATGALTVKQ
jgi:hypothetical protein